MKIIGQLLQGARKPRSETMSKLSQPLHEWSVVAYHQLNVGAEARHAQTREGKIKTYEEARLWALNFIRTTPMVSLVEVCHVEKDESGKYEDVAVHRMINSMGVWKESIMRRPWFEGDYQ